ncbi:MAG: hypothetical protein RBS36_04975 [Thiomicrospira sp.]|jgi:hypothetical protein|nr:hypothetical protein [Thiomicrospira sp.]
MKTVIRKSLSLYELIQKKQALMTASKPPHPHIAAKLLGITEEEYRQLSQYRTTNAKDWLTHRTFVGT